MVYALNPHNIPRPFIIPLELRKLFDAFPLALCEVGFSFSVSVTDSLAAFEESSFSRGGPSRRLGSSQIIGMCSLQGKASISSGKAYNLGQPESISMEKESLSTVMNLEESQGADGQGDGWNVEQRRIW